MPEAARGNSVTLDAVRQFLAEFFRPRASLQELERFAFRLGISLRSGVDVRQALKREAESSYRTAFRWRLGEMLRAVSQGEAFSEALRRFNDFFPPLFVEVVSVGEATGSLAESLLHLAQHYQQRREVVRKFISRISWPATEFAIFLVVIGVFILIFGELAQTRNISADPLGLGLMGKSGFIIYVAFVVLIGLACFVLVRAIIAGATWVGPFQKALLRLPIVGSAIESWYLGQIAWALARTLGVGMSVYKATELSLRSTNHAQYREVIPLILAKLRSGENMTTAFRAAGVFPAPFIEMMEMGEQAGELPEAMDRLSQQLSEHATFSFHQLAIVLAWVLYGLSMLIIVYFIFRLAFFYLSTLQVVG